MKVSEFRNIIFDFGGVIINIDFQRSIDAFKRLGAENFEQIYSKAAQSGVFDELDKGNLTQEEFIEQMKKLLPGHVTGQQVIDAWNDILIDIPAKRIRLLKEIRSKYRIFLLSNTNVIHYAVYNEWMRNDFGYPDFKGLFEDTFLSYRIGMRKPDPKIFELVFQKNALKREETLCIDDSLHIVQATRSYGIPSYWLQEGEDVCELF